MAEFFYIKTFKFVIERFEDQVFGHLVDSERIDFPFIEIYSTAKNKLGAISEELASSRLISDAAKRRFRADCRNKSEKISNRLMEVNGNRHVKVIAKDLAKKICRSEVWGLGL